MTRTAAFDTVFDVAISFAGEDRGIALDLAQRLRERGASVFCDRSEEARLWGTNLVDSLAEVFTTRSRLCIVLVSRYYAAKDWPDFERQHILARAVREPGDFLLPLRLDATPLPGLPDSIMGLDLADHSLDEVAILVGRKLAGMGAGPAHGPERLPAARPGDGELARALPLFQRGDFAGAAGRLRRCLDLDPDNPEAHYYLVLCAVGGKRPKLMSAATVQKAEQHLSAARRLADADKYRLALALIKHDFYVLNGMDPGRPTLDELLTPPPALVRRDLTDLAQSFPAPEPSIWNRTFILEDEKR